MNFEQTKKYDLEQPVVLVEKNGDPRKRAYVLKLVTNTREYWHKIVKDGNMYSPSIFRLIKDEGLLEKKDDGARKHMAPEHIITVMAGSEALGDLISEKKEFLNKDKNDLLLAAAVHDVNKDIEHRAVGLFLDDENKGFGQAGYDLAGDISRQKLKFAGLPENVIRIHDKTGHASCPEIEDILNGKTNFTEKDILKIFILHYIDDIVTNPNIIDPEITSDEHGNRLNALDRRCIQNEKNPTYEKYNLAWKRDERNKTGESAFEMQRRVGHLVERRLAEILHINDPVTLPEVIYNKIQQNMEENYKKHEK